MTLPARSAPPSRPVAIARLVSGPVAGLVAVFLFAVATPLGRQLDRAASIGRFGAAGGAMRFDELLLAVMPPAALLAVVGVLVVAAVRGEVRRGLVGVVAVLGAAASAQVLKDLLPSYPWWADSVQWQGGGSYPSGHTATAMSLALAGLSVCSPWWRRFLLGPLMAGVVLTATATVTVGWHRPSDVLGGLLLSLGWYRVASAVSSRPGRQARLSMAWPGLWLAWWGLASAAVVAFAMRGEGPGRLLRRIPRWHQPPSELLAPAYVGSLAVICLAVAGVFLLATRRLPASGGTADGGTGAEHAVQLHPIGSTLGG